jgi:hypothetical protein
MLPNWFVGCVSGKQTTLKDGVVLAGSPKYAVNITY